jgi:hypothetical protein
MTGDKLYEHECIQCGAKRMIRKRAKVITGLCRKCSMKANRAKSKIAVGGTKTGDGYIRLHISLIDPFYWPMALKSGHIMEHRLVMAQHLGRCLHRWEVVHHKNGIKNDNRITNLQLVSDERHEQITILENHIRYLERENERLRHELSQVRVLV